ncbi:MAG: T9SS type A sorting domain-containing protein [Bacteroidetes bacterium]|nr:T9SS type A sorting domain-containing protein [Bacteroidota bacterium]
MKNTLFAALLLITGLTSFAQRPKIKSGIFYRSYQKEQPVTIEQVEKVSVSPCTSRHPGLKNGDNPGIVTVLDLGTSANVLGYSHGTRTMLWADDDLNVVANIHRMGPGAGLSGYLGMDLGLDMGKTQADWSTQIQVYASNLLAIPVNFDAAWYPSAGIYNPPGNTTLSNAFLAYFAPNYANLDFSGLGGYSYGTANLVDHADTTKHLRWYNAAPHTYIPDGFTISRTGIAHMVDREMNNESGTPVYQDKVIYGRGVWNAATSDFTYTFTTLAFPCKGDAPASDCKIAASPDGNTVWISVLSNPEGATPLTDSTYFPVLRKSTDGGLTWSDPIAVQLDGPNGLAVIKNTYSDYFIYHFFAPPVPSRDEIPYTTAFDHSITVDKWGSVHMGIAIGYAAGGYTFTGGIDSLNNVFDVCSCRGGASFGCVFLGSLKTFRGTWANNTCDNRVYASRNATGDKLFFTWNDTHIDGELNNQNPDVFARGFDRIAGKLTFDYSCYGPSNVTFLCPVTQEAYWQCTSPVVFTNNDKYTIPICTQWFSDATADTRFKYIPDFSFLESDFTYLLYFNNPCPVYPGFEQPNEILNPVEISPNPARENIKLTISLDQDAVVAIEITNLFGQRVLFLDKGKLPPGLQEFSIDVSNFSPGIYFLTASLNEQKYTRKIIVE